MPLFFSPSFFFLSFFLVVHICFRGGCALSSLLVRHRAGWVTSSHSRLHANVVFVYAAEPSGLAWFKDVVLPKDSFKGYDVSFRVPVCLLVCFLSF